jgi:hypothetical protein
MRLFEKSGVFLSRDRAYRFVPFVTHVHERRLKSPAAKTVFLAFKSERKKVIMVSKLSDQVSVVREKIVAAIAEIDDHQEGRFPNGIGGVLVSENDIQARLKAHDLRTKHLAANLNQHR